jgi:hypothetical protein
MKKNYTHQYGEKRRVVEEFSHRSKKQMIVAILVVPVAVLLFSLKKFSQDPVLTEYGTYIGGVAVAALLLFSLVNWRCPSCNKYLGKGSAPTYCPKCGVLPV